MGYRPIDPLPKPLCPWCVTYIETGQATAKVNRTIWHAGCAEDHARAEAGEVRP